MLQRDCFDLPRSRMPCTITSCCIVFYISFISLTNLGYRVTVIDVCTGRLSFSCKLGGDYILLIWAHWMLMVRDNHALNFREWTWRWYSVSVAWVKLEIRFHRQVASFFFFFSAGTQYWSSFWFAGLSQDPAFQFCFPENKCNSSAND